MKNELKIFFTALMFYTRIPVPKSTGFSSDNLNKATRYFPLIGIIVGGIGAIVFFAVYQLLSINIAVLASISSMILLTGAFHEDALSDFCDGFGGGYTKDKILLIMKDSRIGVYGAVGLIILLLSKFILLVEFNPIQIPIIIIVAHALSRINPVILIFTSKYVADESTSKSKPIGHKSSLTSLIIALIIGMLPLLFISPIVIPFIILVQGIVLIYFRYYIHKHLGGYTGDVLGALQQISEVSFYLTYLICIQLI